MCISIIWNRYLRHFRLGKIETIAKSTLQTVYLANVLNARISLQTFSYPKFNFNGWNSSTQFRLNECFWWRYEMMCASVCIRQLSMLLTIWYGRNAGFVYGTMGTFMNLPRGELLLKTLKVLKWTEHDLPVSAKDKRAATKPRHERERERGSSHSDIFSLSCKQ